MTALWVGISVAAAFLQNLRSSLQKHLRGRLSTQGATATRFLYGLPFAAVGLAFASLWLGAAPPPPTPRFAAFALAGSLAQIGATAALLASFAGGSFAAGTTYSKTEGVQALVFGYLFLGDRASAGGLAGVVLTVLGVLAVSRARRAPEAASESVSGPTPESAPSSDDATPRVRPMPASDARRRGIALGLLAGALFAISAVCYRGASLALGDAHFVLRAGLTLVVALCIQSAVTAVGLWLAEPGELTRVARVWRAGIATGLAGAGASAGWFTAVTLVDAAYVKAVGSVELVFAVASSWLVFRETPSRSEIGGIALVMLGVVVTVTLS